MSKDKRLFTDQELKKMGTQTVELLKAAIDAGDKDNARELAQRMYNEAVSTHDLYLTWLTALLSFIGRRYGDQVLEESLRESQMVMQGPFAQEWFRLEQEENFRGKVELALSYLRMHLQPVQVQEDDEKFVFEMHPCGSGGRQVLNGQYEPPMNLLKVARPQPMTYGRPDFPVYCCHGAVSSLMAIDAGMVPSLYEDPSDKLGEKPCRFYMYKDTDKMPVELYAKLGRKKSTKQQKQ